MNSALNNEVNGTPEVISSGKTHLNSYSNGNYSNGGAAAAPIGGSAVSSNHENGMQHKHNAATTQTHMQQHANGNGSYANGGTANSIARRDSTETPLLSANGLGSVSEGSDSHDGLSDATTVLYDASLSNNNEWKDDENINNLKNGLLHHANASSPGVTQLSNHHRQAVGNNNGSLLNGKHGLGLNDKYDEQDPLTGLYTQKHLRPSESDASDYDSVLGMRSKSADHKQPSCGLFGCRPKWARSFASTHVFMVVFLLAYILQGMYMTYFVSVITTIEKLFQIKSKTTGLLLSASEMGQISTAMLLTYFAGRGHRPRWIACGMVLFSIACFACALPHFIFGDQLILSMDSLSAKAAVDVKPQTQLFASISDYNYTKLGNLSQSLGEEHSLLSRAGDLGTNLCLKGDSSLSNNTAECDEGRKLEQASHSKITIFVLCIFFVSLLSSGIGQTAVATLGIPYIDDNVASKQSPMYMAITIGVRILGPASGFIVGSFCTRWYVNFSDPGFAANDPRWIGAWWLGPVVIGSLMMLSSIAMFSFPKQLRGKRAPNETEIAAAAAEPEEKPKLKDFPKTVRRQLSNDILMFRTASCVFHLLPIAGLYTFLPKYLETQFHLATYEASIIAAFCGILVMGIGIVISGLVILKMKPSAKSVAAWIACTALIYSMGMVILMFVGCNMNDFAGYKPSTSTSPATIEPICSAAMDCNCDRESFAPICGVDGKIYISTCHAGCSVAEKRENTTVFSDCACINYYSHNSTDSYEAKSGYCDSQCKNFVIFILIFAVCVFMHSTSEVGSMLLVMRCTHPKDKAMAMGVIQSAIGLFGNVPCPIIYGAVVDSACLIWKTVCGKHGACSLYDTDTFRHYFLGITAGIMFLAFIMDVVVWTKAHRIDIAPEDNNADNKSTEAMEQCKKQLPTPDTSV